MKHVLVRERLIWEALHQDATSDFDVLWEILQSREVQGYVTDSDLTALYHRLAQEQGFGSAHQLTSQFRRVLKVYSPEQDGVLDAAIAHPHDDNPLEPSEDLPTLSVASFLERYVLYQLYQTDTPEVPQGGWYRRWRASGFDPMLLWPVALVLVLQELPAFQQWLLASEMMPGVEPPAHSLFGQSWAIASYPKSDATVATPESRVLTAEASQPRHEDSTDPSPSSDADSPPYPVAPTADPLLIASLDPLGQRPQFNWREVATEHREGDRTPQLPVPEDVELPAQTIEPRSPDTVPEPPPTPALVVAAAPPPAVPPAAPIEPQRLDGFAPRTITQDPGSRPPKPVHVTGGSSFGQPPSPDSGTTVQGGGSVLITDAPSNPEAPTEALPPDHEVGVVVELPSSETGLREPSSAQGQGSALPDEAVATDALLGHSALPHDSMQQASTAADVLLNSGQQSGTTSAPTQPENFLHFPRNPSFQPFSPKNWQDLGIEIMSFGSEHWDRSSQRSSSLQEMNAQPGFPVSNISSEIIAATTL